MKLGLLDLSSSGWTAGQIFTKVVCHGLAGAAKETPSAEVTVISDREAGADVKGVSVRPPARPAPKLPGDFLWRRFQGAPPSIIERTMQEQELDVVLPVVYMAASARSTRRGAMVGWIPDFQHLYLPEFFESAEIQKRDAQTAVCAEACDRILLSSKDALSHFSKRFPEFAPKGTAIPFPSLFAFEPPPPDEGSIHEKFRLPEKYLLVANQFWGHKNHITVIQALGILRQKGIIVPVVFTGQMGDHRSAGTCLISNLLQEAASLGIWDQIRMLGMVSRADLLSLLRNSSAVIQPSRFEGWSTTIEDAKALGRPVICSDIPVHQEQAPDALFFFEPLKPAQLADKLAAAWEHLPAGPDPKAEFYALSQAHASAGAYGNAMFNLCQDAVLAHQSK